MVRSLAETTALLSRTVQRARDNPVHAREGKGCHKPGRCCPTVVKQIGAAMHPSFCAILEHHPRERKYELVSVYPEAVSPPALCGDSKAVELAKLVAKPVQLTSENSWLARQLPSGEAESLENSGGRSDRASKRTRKRCLLCASPPQFAPSYLHPAEVARCLRRCHGEPPKVILRRMTLHSFRLTTRKRRYRESGKATVSPSSTCWPMYSRSI
jgi:hypothetical protein